MDIGKFSNTSGKIDRSADFGRIRLNVQQNLINTEDKVTFGGDRQDLQLMPSRLQNSGKTEKNEEVKAEKAEETNSGTGSKLKDFMHSRGMKIAMLGALTCTTLVGTLSAFGFNSTPAQASDPPANQTQVVQTLKEGEIRDLNLHLLGSVVNDNILSKYTFDFQTAIQTPKTEAPWSMLRKDAIAETTKTEQTEAQTEEKTPEEIRSEVLSPRAAKYDKIIEEAAEKYDVDADFIRSIIQQESQFNHKARSHVGAAGMMQLMPRTAKSLGVKNRLDPRDNIMGGVKYIKQLLDKYNGNKELALAAYNAGPTAVSKYGKVPPYKETQKYVSNIMGMYEQLVEI